jgi:23S rRNA (uracil-5-)-methyltransferase RumA
LDDIAKITAVMTAYAQKYDLPYYSTYNHKGFLRYIVVRRSFAQNTLMVNVVTTTEKTLHEQELIDAFTALALSHRLVSICVTTSDAMGDAVVPEAVRCVWGNDHLIERVGANSYKIFPFTFFQVNPPALPAFYEQILAFADLKGYERVLDLYCGVGTIAAVLSTRCKEVVGVEYTPESVRAAAENAAANGHPNMRFYAGDTGAVIREYAATWKGAFDLMVVNPPRSGVMHKTLEKIVDLKVPTVLYSSCNVKTLAENMAQIHDRYEMIAARPFDFFPQTDHFEVLTVLKRRF